MSTYFNADLCCKMSVMSQEPEKGKSGFQLEKVGQYLKNKPLSDAPDNSANPWVQFLQQTPAVQGDCHVGLVSSYM